MSHRRRRYEEDDEPSRYGDDDKDSYTEHEARYPAHGSGGGRGGSGGGGGRGRGGGDDDGRGVKYIDPNEAKRLQAIIKTEGESEFKNFILYIKDGDHNSNEALDILNGNVLLKQQTFIQEVSLLRVRPPWLNGVPIIVDKAESVAHRGRVCLEFLQNFHQREAVGMMGRRLGRSRRMQFDTGMAFGNNMLMTSTPFDVRGTPAERSTGRAPTYSAREPSGKVTERDVQAYMQKYQMIEDSAKRWQHKR